MDGGLRRVIWPTGWIIARGADASTATEMNSEFYQQQPGRVDGEVE